MIDTWTIFMKCKNSFRTSQRTLCAYIRNIDPQMLGPGKLKLFIIRNVWNSQIRDVDKMQRSYL
jgi:hypothetical protein